jgi:hypothetical protein
MYMKKNIIPIILTLTVVVLLSIPATTIGEDFQENFTISNSVQSIIETTDKYESPSSLHVTSSGISVNISERMFFGFQGKHKETAEYSGSSDIQETNPEDFTAIINIGFRF